MYEDMEFYFLCKRDASVVRQFIDDENLQGSWVEYEFPALSDDPEKIFSNASELIDFLLEAPEEEYNRYEYIVYLEKETNDSGGMYIIGFCGDGGLVFGVPPLDRTPEKLGEYAKKYNCIYGYLSPAHPEIESAEKFRWDAPVLYKNGKMVVVGYPEEFDYKTYI